MNPVYSEISIRHYELVMLAAHHGAPEIPEICRRDTLENLMSLEEKIGIFSVNFIDEFHRISMSLQNAIMQLYGKQQSCRKITGFLQDLSASRNCHDLLMVADEVYACFLDGHGCEDEKV